MQQSLVVLTRPQVGLQGKEAAFAKALAEPLAAGPIAWPQPPQAEAEPDEPIASAELAVEPVETGHGAAPEPRESTTGDEAP